MKQDYLYGTDLVIEQPADLYHMNSDTALLGYFMTIYHTDSVLDIGTNTGALLLYASMSFPKAMTGIDISEAQINACRHNLEINHLEASLTVSSLQSYSSKEKFDAILCNPPFFDTKKEDLKNQKASIKHARHQDTLSLEELMEHVSFLLKENGRFFLVYRPSKLVELMRIAEIYHLYPVRMQIAYASVKKSAKSVLLELRKTKGRDLQIEKPLFLDNQSSYQKGEK